MAEACCCLICWVINGIDIRCVERQPALIFHYLFDLQSCQPQQRCVFFSRLPSLFTRLTLTLELGHERIVADP